MFSRRIMPVGIIALISLCSSGCSSEEPVLTPDTDPKDNGEVTFTIDLQTGEGDGSSSSPAVVRAGETLNMAINQKSTYTDPDGSVFSCEPKAVIHLSAKADTVFARDLAELTKVGGSDIKTSQTGTSPVCHQTLQTFDVGGQDIVFDLSNEVFTYVSSTKEQIEMPYIRLNPAKLGGHSTTEDKSRGSAAVMTGVTVRPLADSRAGIVRDSTMYEVNVRFSMDIESVNAKNDTEQTLEFSVNYVGVVETVTELKDPVGEMSYAWDVKSGTNSIAPPFVKTAGEAMEIWMSENSSYTDEYGNRATAEPKSIVKVTVERDTVFVKTVDELKALADRTEGIPSGHAATQKFGSSLQTVGIEWSYETCEAELAGKTVSMPYYSLTPVTLKDISVKEVSEKEVDRKLVEIYEVTATFSQKASAENVTAATPEVEMEYVVSYVGAIEVPLAKIEYIPGGEWVEPHDNMTLMHHAKVERYRTYANGKRLGPDEFYDLGHPWRMSSGNIIPIKVDLENEWLICYPETHTSVGDSIYIYTCSHQLSQLGEIKYELIEDGYTTSYPGDWDSYEKERWQIDEPETLSVYEDFDNPDYPAYNRECGWYVQPLVYMVFYFVRWSAGELKELAFTDLKMRFDLYDQFLVVDGRRIDFSKLHNLKLDHKLTETDFSDADKEGKIAKLEIKASYLGKNFYGTCIDSIYVAK